MSNNQQFTLKSRRLSCVWFVLAICIALLGRFDAVAQETNSASPNELRYYKVITERNIFNPRRSGRAPATAKPKPVKIDTFTLVGALTYEKGHIALFDGSSSEFRKSLKVGEKIAGFKVTEVSLDHVKLIATNNTALNLRIGSQMKRQDEGEWFLNSKNEPYTSASSSSSSSSGASEKSEPSSSGGDESDILKKLMQQREQELNK